LARVLLLEVSGFFTGPKALPSADGKPQELFWRGVASVRRLRDSSLCLIDLLWNQHRYDVEKRAIMKSLYFLIAAMFAGIAPAYAADLVKTAERSLEIRTFVDALNNAGLSDVLKNRGPFTVFAPSDSAFGRLSANEKKSLLSDRESVEKLVAGHVVQGKMLITEVKPGKTKTIDGSTITLTSDNGLVKVDNASVIQSDVIADNGVIHIIDTVVRPHH
jgi:uncharacterized surface protein with fasciclin (FAS1) repeats